MKTCAIVATRQTGGRGRWFDPVFVYLAVVEIDDQGALIIPARLTDSISYIRVRENQRATARLRNLQEKFAYFARRINAGELKFEEIAAKYAE